MEKRRIIIWVLVIVGVAIFSTALLYFKNNKRRAGQARRKKLASNPQAREAMAELLMESWKEEQRRSLAPEQQSCFDLIERFSLIESKRIQECPCRCDADCGFSPVIDKCISKDNTCTKFDGFINKLKKACPGSLIFTETGSLESDECSCVKNRCQRRDSPE